MTEEISHFVFSDSFAGSLIQALKRAGRSDSVFCWRDDLGFGPIDPPDPAKRLSWISRELLIDFDDRGAEIKRLDDFWVAAERTSARRIAWASKRVVREFADFLEWVWRLGAAPYDVVEFDEAKVTYDRPDGPRSATVNGLALLRPEHLITGHYWDRAGPLDADSRERYRATWACLRGENAPLRVLAESGLVSAPLSFFDDLILSCVVESWRKVARVLGEALAELYRGPFLQTGYLVLHARIVALVAAGRIEGKGDLLRPRFSEVRLPAGRPAEASTPVHG